MVNNFLWDAFQMPEIHLRQPGFIVLVYHLLKTTKEWPKIKETGDSSYIYQNKPDKACLQDDMVYGDFKQSI